MPWSSANCLAACKDCDGAEMTRFSTFVRRRSSGFTTELPPGEGMGIGVVESHGTIVAACATVSVSRRGQLYVDKVVLVVDSADEKEPTRQFRYTMTTTGFRVACNGDLRQSLADVLGESNFQMHAAKQKTPRNGGSIGR